MLPFVLHSFASFLLPSDNSRNYTLTFEGWPTVHDIHKRTKKNKSISYPRDFEIFQDLLSSVNILRSSSFFLHHRPTPGHWTRPQEPRREILFTRNLRRGIKDWHGVKRKTFGWEVNKKKVNFQNSGTWNIWGWKYVDGYKDVFSWLVSYCIFI